MSLINDALKRASQTDRDRARPVASGAPLRPVADDPAFPLTLALVAGVIVTLSAAGFLFWHWWHAGHPATPLTPPPVVAVAPQPAPPPPAARVQPSPPPPAPAPKPVVAPAPVASTITPPPAAPPPAKAADAWPELKLSGIIFSKNNPMAIINGKLLSVGQAINGAHVTKIEPEQVSVTWNGKAKVLELN